MPTARVASRRGAHCLCDRAGRNGRGQNTQRHREQRESHAARRSKRACCPGQRIERVDAPLAPSTTTSDSAAPAPGRLPGQDEIVRGPRELAPRGFALIEGIEREVGERVRELAFTGKDTIDVTFWSPAFLRSDMRSKELPQASLPLARKAAEQVGGFIWRNYDRDAGINVIRITFVRVRRENTALVTADVPAQELTAELTCKQLETGPPRLVSLTVTQR